ncbi:unnamed protein product [Protopolystoma xenopodis]|uniref:THIF-type NAD/FAD binding fold domain-containing protein n=1 Tax=Protopolystoma xenopodis TaxID=117903 RepID=A0A448WA98_9PLAT|nr:unnamed protein product [Protopolystoma xenopodis]
MKIDLDTIDVSNLNRQFLFRKEHIGKSKAEQIARASVMYFNPNVDIEAHHDSIFRYHLLLFIFTFSACFNVEFYKKFTLIFNALDNQAARKHVNRMCVASRRPLIESGTAGYLGQVEPQITGHELCTVKSKDGENDTIEGVSNATDFVPTECYECRNRGTGQRTYPTCTIRNTPSEPIHCVVWANQLFGEREIDDEDISPDTEDPELANSTEAASTTSDVPGSFVSDTTSILGASVDHHQVPCKLGLRDWFINQIAENSDPKSAASALAWRLFHDDIKILLAMQVLWQGRKDRHEPKPLDRSTLDRSVEHVGKYTRIYLGLGTAERI